MLHVLMESLDNLGLESQIDSSKNSQVNLAEAGDFLADKITGGCGNVCDCQDFGWHPANC